MKIAVLNQRYTPYKNTVVYGGIEKVIEYQLALLSKEHEVYFIASSDSDDWHDPRVHTVHLPIGSRDFGSNEPSVTYNKKRNALVISALEEIEPDVVLNHDMSNNSLLKLFADPSFKFPVASYVHQVLYGIGTFAYVEALGKTVENGHSIVMVSKASMTEWIDFVHKDKNKRLNISDQFRANPELYFSNLHYTPFIQENYSFKEEPGDYALMVCRADPIKQVEKATKLCREAGIPFKWVLKTPKSESEIEYFKNISKDMKPEDIHENLPRSEVLDKIAGAKYLFVCGRESFGIASVEGNLSGVPVVLISTNKDHSVKEACNAGELLVLSSKSVKENLAIFKQYDYPDLERRQQIRENTYDFYSEERAYRRIMAVINNTYNTYHLKKRDAGPRTLFD